MNIKMIGFCIWVIGLLFVCSSAKAQSYEAQQPIATFQSTSTMQSSGSAYCSSVYEVGASSPSSSPARGPRKAPPGTGGESGYDPTNPQFSPLGDALIPLLLMVMAYATFVLLRRRKSRS